MVDTQSPGIDLVIPSRVRKRIDNNAILTETNCILAYLTWKRNFLHILYNLYWAAVKKMYKIRGGKNAPRIIYTK
jgi:hypothetical protein